MKAGMTVHVQKLELIGGQGDAIPRRLFTKDGVMVDVNKYYQAETTETVLYDQKGTQYPVVEGGWVGSPFTIQNQQNDGK